MIGNDEYNYSLHPQIKSKFKELKYNTEYWKSTIDKLVKFISFVQCI